MLTQSKLGTKSLHSLSKLGTSLALVALLSGCGGIGGPLSLLTGGGPNIAANTQLGQTNNQTVGVTNDNQVTKTIKDSKVDKVDQSDKDGSVVAEKVETVVVVNDYTIPTWVLILIILGAGFLIPSPKEIVRRLKELFGTRTT